MIKGKFYYEDKKIKYNIVMEEDSYNGNIIVYVKTRFGKFNLFKTDLILDYLILGNEYINKINYDDLTTYMECKTYKEKKKEFFYKWNNDMCNERIKICAEVLIREKIDKDDIKLSECLEVDKSISEFNDKGGNVKC